MKTKLIQKLKNMFPRLMKNLYARANELGVSTRSLFFETTKEMILSKRNSYILGIEIGDPVELTEFVREVNILIASLSHRYDLMEV